VRRLLALAAATLVIGMAMVGVSVGRYLGAGQAPSSTSGLRVFRVDGQLVAYPPYHPGVEPLVIGLGIVLLVAALLASAALHVPRELR
jgi:hypothetical protein